MPGNHTMNYPVYATKQTCVAASVTGLHERRRRLVLYNPTISSFIFNQNNIM